MRRLLIALALLGTLAMQSPLAQARHHDDHGDAVAAGVLGFILGGALADPPRYYRPPVVYSQPRDVVIIDRYPPRRYYYDGHHHHRHYPYDHRRYWDRD